MKILVRLWPYFRPGWHLVLLSLVQIGLTSALGIASPQVIRFVVDRVISEENWAWLAPGAAAVVVVALIQGLLRFGQRYTMELVSQRVIYELRSKLYQHLQSLSFGFYDKAQTGELMSRVTADVEALRHALGMGAVNGIMNMGALLFTIAAMFLMEWRLALLALVFLPALMHAALAFSGRARPNFARIQAQTARLSAQIQENIAGVRVVRSFAQEEAETERFLKENRKFFDANLHSIRVNSFWTNYMKFLTAIGAVSVLWFGGRMAVTGEITVGTLIAFNAYVLNIMNPVQFMGMLVAIFSRAGAASHRIFEILDTRSDVQERPDAVEMGKVAGRVTFADVSFSYEGGGDRVLRNVSLEVQPGQRVAILGLTGSGKSSLINLLPRFYDPTSGRVLIDGTDIREATLDSLRRNIAVVLQETFLFSTTIKENIAYGRPGATMEEITAAAKAAQIHDFVMSLPDQYETVVGERGVGLSGGQKQRVAIARALLLGSPILIMDESTSAVDVQTEQLIQEAMDRVVQGRTSFIIASRLSTVMNADLVVVLDQGRIAEAGTHEELIEREGLYRRIYELQLKPAEEYRASQKGVAV